MGLPWGEAATSGLPPSCQPPARRRRPPPATQPERATPCRPAVPLGPEMKRRHASTPTGATDQSRPRRPGRLGPTSPRRRRRRRRRCPQEDTGLARQAAAPNQTRSPRPVGTLLRRHKTQTVAGRARDRSAGGWRSAGCWRTSSDPRAHPSRW
eukprot:scaffold3854_cov107-Isochrysis_galbana.AAC.7